MNNRKRFLVVGGNPFRSYTGTGSFTSLRLVGATDDEKEANKLVEDHYEDCGGLMEVFDLDNLYLEDCATEQETT